MQKGWEYCTYIGANLALFYASGGMDGCATASMSRGQLLAYEELLLDRGNFLLDACSEPRLVRGSSLLCFATGTTRVNALGDRVR